MEFKPMEQRMEEAATGATALMSDNQDESVSIVQVKPLDNMSTACVTPKSQRTLEKKRNSMRKVGSSTMFGYALPCPSSQQES
jgi:hypothetical protein